MKSLNNNLPDFLKQKDDIRKKLLYSQSERTTKRPSPQRRPHSPDQQKSASSASGLPLHEDLKTLQQLMLSIPTENYGQVLYLKGRAQAMTQEKKRQVQQQLNVQKEMADATFKPDLCSKSSARDRRIKTEDFLLYQGRLADEKKEKLKQELERQEMQDVSFKPSILKKSERMVAKRNE